MKLEMNRELLIVVLCFIVIAALTIAISIGIVSAPKNECSLRGGLTVKTAQGWACIRADMIK